MSKLRLSVENFGPVRHGTFELSPLTVFIGPNNSGKSYLALLAYTLCRAVSSGPPTHLSPLRSGRGYQLGVFQLEGQLAKDETTRHQMREWLSRPSAQKTGDLAWTQLPKTVQGKLSEIVQCVSEETGIELARLLREYFGLDGAVDLLRRGAQAEEFRVVVNKTGRRLPLLNLELSKDLRSWNSVWRLPTLRSVVVSPPDHYVWAPEDPTRQDDPFELLYRFSMALVQPSWDAWMATNGFPRGNAYYLPVARSGVLSGWQAFASMAVDLTRQRFGLEQIQVPAFTGITGDFLQVLLWIFQHQRGSSELDSVLQVLNRHIFEGEVTLRARGFDRPSIVYTRGGAHFPIHRTSSMVGELAPLSLWIQYVVNPGDLIIIDEPEAHLHPETQREIAQVLVRLVRAGVTVLCTTHSSIILHQLSNHILLSHAKLQEQKRLGFTPDDVLDVADLGVYLFDAQSDGTRIKAVHIDAETGIDEEEFVRVMEAIGEETYRLALQRDQVAA